MEIIQRIVNEKKRLTDMIKIEIELVMESKLWVMDTV